MILTIPADRAARIRVWILIPCRALNALAPHHITLLGVLRQHGIWYSLRTLPGDSLVTRSRNNLADIFLRESTDDDNHFALWLDDDVIFSPESVLQLLALDLDFVAAPYTKKGLHMDRMAAAANLHWKSCDLESVSGSPNVNFLMNSLRLDLPVPILEAGSGFWLHKRKVLTMMVVALPHIRYKRSHEERGHYGSDHAHDFFRVGVCPDTNEYLSEDWWFCREWRRLGGTLHCCFWIKTQHLGPHMYQMDMDAILGLLNQTGGYIYGETCPTKEINDAPTQVRPAGPIPDHWYAGTENNFTFQPVVKPNEHVRPDILRAIAAVGNGRTPSGDRASEPYAGVPASDEATVPRDPGPLGG